MSRRPKLFVVPSSERVAWESYKLRQYLFGRGLLSAGKRLSAIQKAKTQKRAAPGLSIHHPITKESSNEQRKF